MTATAYLTPKPYNNTSHLPICPSPPRREASRAYVPPVSSCQPMPFPTLKRCITDDENSGTSTGSNSNKNKPLVIRLKPRPSKYRLAAKISKSDSARKNAVHSMSRSTSGKALSSMTRSASYQYLMGSSSKPRSSLPRRPSFHSRAA